MNKKGIKKTLIVTAFLLTASTSFAASSYEYKVFIGQAISYDDNWVCDDSSCWDQGLTAQMNTIANKGWEIIDITNRSSSSHAIEPGKMSNIWARKIKQ
ncbi:MAG: hypothetical protein Rsou_0329 [Candidatus Ruthia sp. Asou_11_S2]|nr:hypothetical protein [Candidatus Ruthia sp. Asou_11_S2]